MARTIIHFDLDAFFCAVEEILNPELRGKAFAVGGSPEKRGVVSSCSYPARKFGIHSAMPMARAVKICKELLLIKPKFSEYIGYSKRVMNLVKSYSDLFEQISIDEAYIDVSHLKEDGATIALQIQNQIKAEYGLPSSFGVATSKLVAKIATDAGKSKNKGKGYPFAITVVLPGEELDFLAPLPVMAMIGIGPKTTARLREMGIHTIGELARLPESSLVSNFGKFGHELFLRSKGIDDSPIYTSHEIKSISNETTFPKDTIDEKVLHNTLLDLTHSVCQRLIKEKLCASTIRIKIRWSDFSTITRQMTLVSTTKKEEVIFPAAYELFNRSWRKNQPVRLLGVGVSNLSAEQKQLGLWDEIQTRPSLKEEKLLEAIEFLENRYGSKVIQRGIHDQSKQNQ
jgi:DNA polymerase-4